MEIWYGTCLYKSSRDSKKSEGNLNIFFLSSYLWFLWMEAGKINQLKFLKYPFTQIQNLNTYINEIVHLYKYNFFAENTFHILSTGVDLGVMNDDSHYNT